MGIPYAHEVMANDLANDHLPKLFQLDCESVPGGRRSPNYSNHAFNRLQCTRQYLDLKEAWGAGFRISVLPPTCMVLSEDPLCTTSSSHADLAYLFSFLFRGVRVGG
jgi:hypothetical protein